MKTQKWKFKEQELKTNHLKQKIQIYNKTLIQKIKKKNEQRRKKNGRKEIKRTLENKKSKARM